MNPVDNRANSQNNITAKQGSRPKSLPYTDFSMASLTPVASPQQNVTGQVLSPVDEANQLVADAGNLQLGTAEWERVQLAKAIMQLRAKYTAAANQSGGSINDPFWSSEYDKAVEAALDDIRSQSANNRQTTEEAQKARDFEAQQAKIQQAEDRKNIRDTRKYTENSAMFEAGGKGLMDYLTTPRGGVESKMAYGPILDKAGKPVMDVVKDGQGNIVSQSERWGMQQVPGKQAQAPIDNIGRSIVSGSKSLWNNLISGGFSPSGLNKLPGGNSEYVYNDLSNYFAPSLAGSTVGALVPGKGNVFSKMGAGMVGGGVNQLAGYSNPWSNLISSAGTAWANPFSKDAWSSKKNSTNTMLKLGGTALLSGLSRFLGR